MLAIVAFAGCRSGQGGDSAVGESRVAGVTFNPKSGLLVPADTAELIGLELMDVTEREVAATTRFGAQVYQISANGTNRIAWASGLVNLSDAEQLRDGRSLAVETGGSERLPARLKGFGGELEQNGALVEVLVEIADASGRLSVADYVEVTACAERGQGSLTVPKTALLQTLEGNFVYTVSGERLVRTAIETGVMTDEYVEITDGLYEGDRIAVRPTMALWLAELQAIRGGKACADGD